MKRILLKFEPVDFIALIFGTIAFVLMYMGKDGVVGGALALIVGYYFGHKREREAEEMTYEKITPPLDKKN